MLRFQTTMLRSFQLFGCGVKKVSEVITNLTVSEWVAARKRQGSSYSVARPQQAPLSEFAAAMASDDFGRVNQSKQCEALKLLNSPHIKQFHVVVGQKVKSPIVMPKLFETASFWGTSKTLSLDEEVKQKETEARKKAQPPEFEDIRELRTDDLLRFRGSLKNEDVWPDDLDLLCSEVVALKAPDNARVPGISADDLERSQTSKEMCEHLGLNKSGMKKAALKVTLFPYMESQGWSNTSLESFWKSLDKKGVGAPGRGMYNPVKVINAIVSSVPKRHDTRPNIQPYGVPRLQAPLVGCFGKVD
jgi:hypothetical protein